MVAVVVVVVVVVVEAVVVVAVVSRVIEFLFLLDSMYSFSTVLHITASSNCYFY